MIVKRHSGKRLGPPPSPEQFVSTDEALPAPGLPEDYIEVGGEIDGISVSLRIFAPDLDPDVVTRLLGVMPSFAARKGDRRPSGEREVVQPTGIWSLEHTQSRGCHLGDAIGALLDRVTNDLSAWRKIAGFARSDVFCGLYLEAWNRGVDLSPVLLGRLAERHIALSLDIYCDGSFSDVVTEFDKGPAGR